jgi:hypothetical protein
MPVVSSRCGPVSALRKTSGVWNVVSRLDHGHCSPFSSSRAYVMPRAPHTARAPRSRTPLWCSRRCWDRAAQSAREFDRRRTRALRSRRPARHSHPSRIIGCVTRSAAVLAPSSFTPPHVCMAAGLLCAPGGIDARRRSRTMRATFENKSAPAAKSFARGGSGGVTWLLSRKHEPQAP